MKTFQSGGVHPPSNKLSAGQPIRTLGLPAQVVIPLAQHIGAPAKPCVAKGDRVKVGTPLGVPEGFVSAAICSPVSGKVLKVDDYTAADGYPHPAVYIAVEGDEWEACIDRSETFVGECTLEPAEILKKIKDAGIVGMGGAAFPTHVKLSPPPGMKAEVLLVNAAECEPYLTADDSLMREKPDEILAGTTILMKALGVSRAVIGIENNKPEAIRLLGERAAQFPGVEITPLKVRYPQGSEKHFIEAILGRRVKRGALPISTGAVVLNVASVFAVYEAVQKNKPLVERVVTVTGKQVLHPSDFRVRIGTAVETLIEAAGGLPQGTGKMVLGGPMMGRASSQLNVPVLKGTSGVLLIPEEESERDPVQPCVRCALCVSVCPMGLEPYLISALYKHGDFESLEREQVMDCIECGCCHYTCPAHRPLLDCCRSGKARVGAMIRARKR